MPKKSMKKIERLDLGKGKEILKIGNMRFERIAECGDVWTGVLELEGEEIPIFGCVDLGLTVDQIRECWEATGLFLKASKK